MSRLRRRKQDREIAARKLEETEQKIIDLAVRRARLEVDVELYVLRTQKKGERSDRSG